MMEYITLNHSDLRVSRVCMGGCPMGGYGWGRVQEQELVNAVHAALDTGINFFDTADTYGLGQSERTLGKALAGRRDDAVIATKFAVRVENGETFFDNSPEWIRTACENSLRRLGTDYIDLYQVHYRDGVTPIGDVLQTLGELRREGKVRYFGLSNLRSDALREIEPCRGEFITLQNEYSLACRKNEGAFLDYFEKLDMNPMTWGSLGQGILTGKYDRNAAFGEDDRRSREIYVNFHGEKLLKNLELVERMKVLARKYDKPVSAVAIRFILDHLPGSVVLCGAKRPDQIQSNAQGMGWSLEKDDMELLEQMSR